MALRFILFRRIAGFLAVRVTLNPRRKIVVNLKQPINQPTSGSGLRFFIPAMLLLVVAGVLIWLVCRPPSAQAAAKQPAVHTPATEIAKPPPPPPPVPVEPTIADLQLVPPAQLLPASMATAVGIARTGILIDLTNRQILWEKKADEPVEIASMTKMMTIYLLMQALQVDKSVTLTEVVPVSKAAAEIGGSQAYLDSREKFTVEDLAKVTMVQSANDAAYLLAERLANGSASTFVAKMNETARKMGLVQMHFYNPHGLPPDPARKTPENSATARELAFLASRLLEYPDALRWSSTVKYVFHHQVGNDREMTFKNHNSLVGVCQGVNGMKTGYTAKSMYCTTITSTRDGRTMILVLSGCPRGTSGGNGSARDNLAKKLLDWAYSMPAGTPAVPIAKPAVSTVPAAKPVPKR